MRQDHKLNEIFLTCILRDAVDKRARDIPELINISIGDEMSRLRPAGGLVAAVVGLYYTHTYSGIPCDLFLAQQWSPVGMCAELTSTSIP